MKVFRSVLVLMAVALASGACGTRPTASTATPQSAIRSLSTASPASPAPTPFDYCPGGAAYGDIVDVVNTGYAVALVDVDVDGPYLGANTDPTHMTSLDDVTDATLLAGSLPNGDVAAVRETTGADGPRVLQPGHYVLFLGRLAGDPEGIYYLADGTAGSFVVAADGALSEQCATIGTGQAARSAAAPAPSPATSTSEEQLISFASTALPQVVQPDVPHQ